jgi:type III secretion protein Q
MIITPLNLPQIDGLTVAALRRLGRGLRMPYRVADQQGELILESGEAPACVAQHCFSTACGVVAFGKPGPVLSLLGECPVTLASEGNDPDSWLWELFQHHLSPQVQSLFSYFHVQDVAPHQALGCRLTVTLGTSRVVDRLTLAPDTLLALCAAGPWQPLAHTLPSSFPVSVPVLLGSLRLTLTQLSSVRPGDVLMMEFPMFIANGDGQLRLGRHRLQGRLDAEDSCLRLIIFSIEDTALDDVNTLQGEGYGGDAASGNEEVPVDVFGHEPFDELTMALSVRCGTLQLSLGELRQLAPGTVVGVSGYSPGMAGLYYGDRPIGQGQLVDVDGRLGLQLSRVIFSR